MFKKTRLGSLILCSSYVSGLSLATYCLLGLSGLVVVTMTLVFCCKNRTNDSTCGKKDDNSNESTEEDRFNNYEEDQEKDDPYIRYG